MNKSPKSAREQGSLARRVPSRVLTVSESAKRIMVAHQIEQHLAISVALQEAFQIGWNEGWKARGNVALCHPADDAGGAHGKQPN